jgi:hypothetical protein
MTTATTTTLEIAKLGDEELLARVRGLVARSNETEALLLVHLAEVDERKLYLPRRTSLWDFCLYDLGFSENIAWSRIAVARESRRHPQVLEMLRTGRIHLSGLKLLCGQLSDDADALLAEAAGKTKRQIEEILARRHPKPAVPDRIRKLPSTALPVEPNVAAELLVSPPAAAGPADTTAGTAATAAPPPVERTTRAAVVAPLSAEAYLVQFTADPELRDQIRLALDLSRHGNPRGDLATMLREALGLLIEKRLKQRFAVGRKARQTDRPEGAATSRHVPAEIQRAVYERDGGRCTYVDPDGRRCDARAFLTFDHVDGYARTLEHRADAIRLLCAPHNQHAANVMYTPSGGVMHPGKQWMNRRRLRGGTGSPRDA